MSFRADTITAIATPLGEGGLSVIRVSGPEAFRIVTGLFHGKRSLSDSPSHTLHVGRFVDQDGAALDQVVCSTFRSPHSYTGEDVVEISCHGGTLVTRRILESLLRSGARHAEPGEFTRRAFVNGRMDLAQAEAVAELIRARSDKAREASMRQMRGDYSERVRAMRQEMIDALGLLELELDFAEDGYEFVDKSGVEQLVRSSLSAVSDLLSTYAAGRVIRDGVDTVLVGAPNVGKSSLMNRLLRESRAIVTEIPGTTRDVISENIMIRGVLFRLSDTAGLRVAQDPVELEGVRRSEASLREADLVLLVLDQSRPLADQLNEIGLNARDLLSQGREKVQVVVNKIDLPASKERLRVGEAKELGFRDVAMVSALTGDGIEALELALLSHIPGNQYLEGPESEIIISSRHFEVFRRVETALQATLRSITGRQTGEFIAVDLRSALNGLGEITGQITNDEIMNSVFSRFCIGK